MWNVEHELFNSLKNWNKIKFRNFKKLGQYGKWNILENETFTTKKSWKMNQNI